MPAKKKTAAKKAAPKEEAVVKEPVKPTGKFEVVLDDGEYFVYNPEGVRVSGALDEAKAIDLAQGHQRFLR